MTHATPGAGKAVKPAVRRVALWAVAFGCVIVYCREFTAASAQVAFDLGTGSAAQFAAMCSEGRLLALVVLMIAGCSRKRIVNRSVLLVSGAVMVLCAALLGAGVSVPVQGAAAFGAGIASGVALFSLMLAMSAESVNAIVVASFFGLAVGGMLLGAAAVLPHVLGEPIAIVSAAAAVVSLAFADPSLSCYEDHGVFTREELRRFPWFASVMLVMCGFAGMALYGAANGLSWLSMGGPDYAVMGVLAVVVIAVSACILVMADNWTQLVWVPSFALLLCILVWCCTSTSMLGPVALGFLMAAILAFHFLRLMVIAAIVSTSLLPRYFTNGVFLVLTSAALAVDIGPGLYELLPVGLQTPGGMGGTLAVVLLAVFAVVMLVERFGRDAEYEEPVQMRKSTAEGSVAAAEEGGLEGAESAAAAFEAPAGQSAPEPEPAALTIKQRCDSIADEFGLTAREREVCTYTARGHSSKAIAEQLVVSGSTVRFHQQNIYKKLGIHSKQELIDLVERRSS